MLPRTKALKLLPWLFDNLLTAIVSLHILPTIGYTRTSNTDCAPIDLSPAMPSIRDQDTIGWCYAYAAADLLSYATKSEISPVSVAHRYVSKYPGYTKPFMGGHFAAALQITLNEPTLCRESSLPSRTTVNGTFFNSPLIVKAVKKAPKFNQPCDTKSQNLWTTLFPTLKTETLDSIVKEAQALDTSIPTFTEQLDAFVSPTFSALVKKACENESIQKPQVSVHAFSTFGGIDGKKVQPSGLIDELNKQLNLSTPVGISYNAGRIIRFLPAPFAKRFKRSYAHASVIVGRQWNEEKNSCDYLLRNSWGTGCSIYPPRMRCRNGHIWIDEKTLEESLFSVTYLYKR